MTHDGKERRSDYTEMFKISNNLGFLTAQIESLNAKLDKVDLRMGELNNSLTHLCDDCGPSRFVDEARKDRQKLYWVVATAVIAMIIQTIFGLLS